MAIFRAMGRILLEAVLELMEIYVIGENGSGATMPSGVERAPGGCVASLFSAVVFVGAVSLPTGSKGRKYFGNISSTFRANSETF